jgi:segregation and condensation protein B
VTMNPAELKGALEAVIYAADEPASIDQMATAIGAEKAELKAALEELIASYAADERGLEIRKVAGGYKFYTKAQHHDAVRRFIKSLRPPLRLTMPALETLAVISYKQPVTGPEIQEIRGVNCSGVIQTLLEKRLITTAGRKAVIGRPILYRTSKEFLMRFGLSDLDELPSLKEFEQLARAALGADEGIAPIEPGDVPEGLATDLAPEESAADGDISLEGSAAMADATGSSEMEPIAGGASDAVEARTEESSAKISDEKETEAETEGEADVDSKTRAAENGS